MKMFGMDASESTSTCQSRRGVQMMTRRVRPRAARETQEEPLACGELVSEQGTHRASARAHAAKANMWRQVWHRGGLWDMLDTANMYQREGVRDRGRASYWQWMHEWGSEAA